MKKFMLIMAIAVFALPVAFAQNVADDGSDLTIEEMYLQRQQTIETYFRLAKTADINTRLLVIEELEKLFEEGELSADDTDMMEVLEYLASTGSTIISRQNNRRTLDHPEVRMFACRLLGKIGGERASRILRMTLINEKEPMVLSEAVYGLGLIGENADNRVTSLITHMLTKLDVLGPDNNLAYSSLLALERIARQNNGIQDQEVLRVVIRLMYGNYILEVRNKAAEVFELLNQYM